MSHRVVGIKSVLVTIPTPAAPIKILAQTKNVTGFEVYNPTGNQVVRVGEADVAVSTHIPRAANTITVFSTGNRDFDGRAKEFDLSTLYILGTAGEVVTVSFTAPLLKTT